MLPSGNPIKTSLLKVGRSLRNKKKKTSRNINTTCGPLIPIRGGCQKQEFLQPHNTPLNLARR